MYNRYHYQETREEHNIVKGETRIVYMFMIWNDEDIFIKIGIAVCPSKRLKTVLEDINNKRKERSHYYGVIPLVSDLGSSESARARERYLHGVLCDHKKDLGFKFDGYTECFTLNAIEQLYFCKEFYDSNIQIILLKRFMAHCNTLVCNKMETMLV